MQLKKRAYVSNNPREFIDYIEEYIKTRNVSEYPVDLTNNSFMVQYGTDIHTHNSAEKAVKKLIEIIH
jgi:phosphatidate phosphatase APP1